MVVPKVWGLDYKWEMTANGYKVSSWGDKNILKLIVVMDPLLYEHMKNH